MTAKPAMDLRVRALLGINKALTRARLMPTVEQAIGRPLEKRRATRPPRWTTGAISPDVSIRDLEITGRNGAVPLRLYAPKQDAGRGPVVLFLHGGGWVSGGLDTMEHFCAQLSSTGRLHVVSVDYRLSPGAPYPTALHEVYDALQWVADHPAEVGGNRQIAVMGDSAGGNLAAAVCLLTRDEGGPAIAHQTLLYPGLDLTLSSPSLDDDGDGIGRKDLEAVVASYAGGTDPRDPLVSPLLADDLSGLPPALIITAALDPLRDDGKRYARALTAAGVPVRYTNYARMPHGFLSTPRLSRSYAQAVEEIIQELLAVNGAIYSERP